MYNIKEWQSLQVATLIFVCEGVGILPLFFHSYIINTEKNGKGDKNMGFLNNIFGPKNKTEKKEKTIPEYHKCPMCGEMVKTRIKLYGDNPERYLDGEPKITASEIANSLQFCEKCGYIYKGYNYDVWKDGAPSVMEDEKRKFQSDAYKKVFQNNDIDPVYKKLLLHDLICGRSASSNECGLLHEYKYCIEQNNITREQGLLERQLEYAINNNVGQSVEPQTLCFHNKLRVHISQQDIIVDLLRRLGRFDEAKTILINRIEQYKSKKPNNEIQMEYFNYQLHLIESQDKRHI